MLVSDYIQWHLDQSEMNEVTAPFAAYSKAKKDLINQQRAQRYSQIIKAQFNNDENMEKYFNLVNSILGDSSFQGAVSTAVDKIAFPSMTNMQLKYVNRIQEILKNDVDQFQKLVSEIYGALEGIISAFGVMDIDKVISPEANAALDQIFGKSPNKTKFVKHKDYLQLDNVALGQYKYLLSLLPDFASIVQSQGAAGTDASIQILSKLLVPIQTLIGFSTEFQVNYEVEKILKDLEKSTNNSNITIKRVGSEGSNDGGYKIGTADLSLTLGENAHLNFNLPNLGMSLKRSSKNLNTADYVNIKLKGSTYGKMLRDVDPNLLTAFYTIYAYTNPKGEGDIPVDSLNAAYKMMKMEASISALIGNIDVEDLVFVLVVNNKAITIFDLLNSMSTSNSDPFTLTPAFRSVRGSLINQHKSFYQKDITKAIDRSNKLRSYIENKMSASVTMKLTKAQLASFK